MTRAGTESTSTVASAKHREIGVGVVGLGLMGRVHVEAYAAAARDGHACRLVAVSDRDPKNLSGRSSARGNLHEDGTTRRLFDPSVVRTGVDAHDVFAHPDVELVSICTPTDTHVALATAALRAGKHVLLEKPVSLDPLEIDALARVAAESGRFCMPAMCMRFWPGWSWLAEAVRDGRYGRVTSAVFQRNGSRPTWGAGFYADPRRSGGALFDLHVHDVDFVRHLFGEPESVESTGSLDHVTTLYRYPSGPAHVVAEGGWDHAPGFPFRMRYVVVFEGATAEFDLRRDPPLEIARGGKLEPVVLGAGSGYDGEIRHALECVAEARPEAGVTLAEAAAVTRLLIRERESFTRGIDRRVR